MGKPGDKNQSSTSNIFKRVPNANYESTEAIVPGIGSMSEQSSEDVYMSDPAKSPLQQSEVADADKYKEQFTKDEPSTVAKVAGKAKSYVQKNLPKVANLMDKVAETSPFINK